MTCQNGHRGVAQTACERCLESAYFHLKELDAKLGTQETLTTLLNSEAKLLIIDRDKLRAEVERLKKGWDDTEVALEAFMEKFKNENILVGQLRAELAQTKADWNRQAAQWNVQTLRDVEEIRGLRAELARLKEKLNLREDRLGEVLVELAAMREALEKIAGEECWPHRTAREALSTGGAK